MPWPYAAAEAAPVVSTAAEAAPVVSTAAEAAPVVSTAVLSRGAAALLGVAALSPGAAALLGVAEPIALAGVPAWRSASVQQPLEPLPSAPRRHRTTTTTTIIINAATRRIRRANERLKKPSLVLLREQPKLRGIA
jgi:hypothetical protein